MNKRCYLFGIFFFLCLLAGSLRADNVGGTLTADTVWSPAQGTVTLTSSVVVPAGVNLTIEAGTQVHVSNGLAIQIQAGGTLDIAGTGESPVFVLYLGSNNQPVVNASGNNSMVTIRHAEFSHGGITFGSQATGLIEDTYVHDIFSAIVGNSARHVTLRRVHVTNSGEVICNGTLTTAEDSLFENLTSSNNDAFELQGAPPGCEVSHCTMRHGLGSNTDAVDLNGSQNVFIHDCLIYDVADKGISLGTATAYDQAPSTGIVVSNCLIYAADSCIAVKDKSTASIFNCTFVNSAYGIRLYEKYAPSGGGAGIGGKVTNGFNNIMWGNSTADALVASNSLLVLTYSDVGGTNLAGAGNLSVDPLFVNAAARDYRLRSDSPLLRAGANGGLMGTHFPVGAPMASSHPTISSAQVNGGDCVLRFWVDEGKPYRLESSDSVTAEVWQDVASIPAQVLPRQMNVTNAIAATQQFYRLVTP